MRVLSSTAVNRSTADAAPVVSVTLGAWALSAPPVDNDTPVCDAGCSATV